MPKRLSPKSTLDTLKTEAKRRLKAMRAADPAARLRAAQLAVAQDYGFDGWTALRAELEALALARLTDAERADALLRAIWPANLAVQARILARSPDLAHVSLPAAIAFGDLAEVRRRLALDPGAATRRTGPLNWEPLLYLAFARLPLPAAGHNAVAIAEALLDAGADPNTPFDDGWGNPFKPITGVIGHGEGVRPEHPQAKALVDLFIARGADPFDTQALYDTSIVRDETRWLDVLWTACEPHGGTERWFQVGRGLSGRFPMKTLDYLLGNAVSHGHPQRVRWLIEHGADPNSRHAYSGQRQHTFALTHGAKGMAQWLEGLGATPEDLAPTDAFIVAALAGDRPRLEALLRSNPELLETPQALRIASEQGHIDVVRLLLDLGQSPNLATDDGWRPLHHAARRGSIPLADLLIAAGAEIDAREFNYDSTALGGANFFGQRAMYEHLAAFSADIFTMAAANDLGRLASLLRADPSLAAARRKDGRTLLFHLPDDEDAAVEVARLLLAHGVEPRTTNAAGVTAAQAARRQGLEEAADLIEAAAKR